MVKGFHLQNILKKLKVYTYLRESKQQWVNFHFLFNSVCHQYTGLLVCIKLHSFKNSFWPQCSPSSCWGILQDDGTDMLFALFERTESSTELARHNDRSGTSDLPYSVCGRKFNFPSYFQTKGGLMFSDCPTKAFLNSLTLTWNKEEDNA